MQILNNLLGNAAKFTARGHISVGAGWRDESRQQVAVYVLDSGIGIPKHKLSSIFLPFEQVSGGVPQTAAVVPTFTLGGRLWTVMDVCKHLHTCMRLVDTQSRQSPLPCE
jgi:K+-sensing histidine kinase KdpD